jgi:magnesium chelatase subunit I
MNELPDLSPKIQVGLFNVLEERDVQIRGYPVRLELDVCLVFSANPEDYTNRGRIVTPLKDRIGSVIRTHYPLTREAGIAITDANAWTERDGGTRESESGVRVFVPHFMKEVLEETARLARTSPAVNQASGVSVRMSIANAENMVSNAERRGLLTDETVVVPRISDLAYLAASARGKLELNMSEDEGQEDRVIDKLIGEAVKNVFEQYFNPKHFRPLVEWFENGQTFVTGDRLPSADYVKRLAQVPAFKQEINRFLEKAATGLAEHAVQGLTASAAELVLEGLHVTNRLNKSQKEGKAEYKR